MNDDKVKYFAAVIAAQYGDRENVALQTINRISIRHLDKGDVDAFCLWKRIEVALSDAYNAARR